MLRRIAALMLICQPAAALRPTRRQALKGTAGSTVMLNFLPGAARAAAKGFGLPTKETNDVVTTVDGIRRKRLGNSDIAVSELALGTQRWGGADFNSPDEELCHQLLDRGVLEGGINLIDTAEQYPIPSDRTRPEGATEEIMALQELVSEQQDEINIVKMEASDARLELSAARGHSRARNRSHAMRIRQIAGVVEADVRLYEQQAA